ncbi:helix-turn-helix domain-containing protein [Serratia fonticola]
MLNIGIAIKQCRDARGLTLQQLAINSGLTKSYLSRVENGQRDPTILTIENIANALHIPVNLIILLAEDEDKDDLSSVFKPINNMLKKAIMEELESGKKLEV